MYGVVVTHIAFTVKPRIPWYYFADVPIKKKSGFSIADDFYVADYPSVQYRGILILRKLLI